jgi:hypothetical protein
LVAKRAIRFMQTGWHCPIRFRQEWLDEFVDAGSVAPAKRDKPSLGTPASKAKVHKLNNKRSHGLSYSLLQR